MESFAIHAAAAAHPWNELASGQAVSVSIGLAKAHAGETIESVLHRSDLAMYEAKSASRVGRSVQQHAH